MKKLFYNLLLGVILTPIYVFVFGFNPIVCSLINFFFFTFKTLFELLREQKEEIEMLKEIIKNNSNKN